jgi:hypothetical protein
LEPGGICFLSWKTTDLSEVFTHLVLDEAEFCGLAIEVIDVQAGGGILFQRECLK